ncbi:hypothetical protein QUF64_15095 [Anaerolineales bacterium HSG6]|nr:hypothetical protein [Anaerolineales bacterium HSG6]
MKHYLKFIAIIILLFFSEPVAIHGDTSSDVKNNLPTEKYTAILLSELPDDCVEEEAIIDLSMVEINELESDETYTVIVDAGSSGNRVHLFKWQESNGRISEIETVEFKSKAENSVPLSGFGNRPECASVAYKGLNSLLEEVENKGGKAVEVYILATAGMRGLSDDEQKKIYTALCEYLNPWVSETCLETNIRTITGNEEAGFAWLSINRDAIINNEGRQNTQNILELGGASMQIAFLTDSEPAKNDRFIFTQSDEEIYTLYAVSYLGLGQNKVSSHLGSIMTSPNQEVFSCYPTGFKPPDKTEAYLWNAEQCDVTLQTYLESETLCSLNEENKTHCDSNNLELSIPDAFTNSFEVAGEKEFTVLSNFYHTANILGLTDSWTLSDFNKASEGFCGKSWDDLVKENEAPEKFLKNYCFSATYINLLLEEFGFDDTNRFKAFKSDWTGGAMLYYATESRNDQEKISPPDTMPISGQAQSVPLTLVLLLLTGGGFLILGFVIRIREP